MRIPGTCEHVDSEILRMPDGTGELYCRTCGVQMLAMSREEFKADWEGLHAYQQRTRYPELYLVKPKPPKVPWYRRLARSLFG